MLMNYRVFKKQNTIAYVSAFNEFGELVTDIYTTTGVHRVERAPIELIDTLLKSHGSSYRGAKDGSKFLLGGIDMAPIVICREEGLYLFPSESPSSPTCKWFYLHHIVNYHAIGKKKTAVQLTNGLVLKVNVSKSAFASRLTNATLLKVRMEGRNLGYHNYDIDADYQMVKEFQGDGYRVKGQNE